MRWAAWALGLVVLAGGVLLLRAELMTVDLPTPAGSRTQVLATAQTREDEADLPEMVRALVSECRLLVNADVVETSFRSPAPGRFAFSVEPGLDEFDVRELKGCLSDARVQHLLVDVEQIETTVPLSAPG